MTINLSSVSSLQAEWQGVVQMRDRIRHLAITMFTLDARVSLTFGDVLYNLPLLLAFDVLRHVLIQAREDGYFTGSGYQLEELLLLAKTSLPWVDWQCLQDVVKRHNEVKHSGKLFGDVQCLRDIGDIETQLLSWGIIHAA